MPLYTNNNAVSKSINTIYSNINGSSKNIINTYANVNNLQKAIFEAKKYQWYKKYNVTSWEMIKSYNNYNSDTDDDDLYTEMNITNYSLYGFTNASVDNNGKIYLSGPIKLTWTSEEPTEESWGTSYIKNCDQKNFYFDWNSYTTSYNHSTYIAYYIDYAYMHNMESSSSDLYYTIFSIVHSVYAAPSSHSSNYTMIKVNSNYKSYYAPNLTKINNDGSYNYYTNYCTIGDFNGNSGYGCSRNYDDTKDSDGNYTDIQYYSYDGYYWEYEGQHY